MAIASCLVDTNVLLRITRRSDPQHQVVDTALAKLANEATLLCYTHQNIAELWNAMTRPRERNGLGLSINEAETEVRLIESGMTLLPDSAEVYTVRRSIRNGGGLSLPIGYRAFRCTTRAWQQRCTFME